MNFNSGKNIAVVIQLTKTNEKEVLARLKAKASSLFGLGRFAYILHDKDVLETNEKKGNHIHLVLMAEKAMSSNNWLKHFSELLDVELSAVSVEMLGSEKKMLRYLRHLDDANKHEYDASEVITNMPDRCKTAWEASSGFVTNPTLEQLETASKQGAKAIYNLVGMNGFNKAMKVLEAISNEESRIEAMWQEVNGLYKALCEVTANPNYIKAKAIPLKDFVGILKACSVTMEEMLRIKEFERNAQKWKD